MSDHIVSDPPFVRGSETSEAAAASMKPRAAAIRERVYGVIVGAGAAGATCDEVEELLGLRHQTASARVRELVLAGRIVKAQWVTTAGNAARANPHLATSTRVLEDCRRRTRSGRTANVYVLPQFRVMGDVGNKS